MWGVPRSSGDNARLFDSRWVGAHGIGRYSAGLLARLDGFRRITLKGRPSAPIDPLRLALYLKITRPRLYFSPGYNAPAAGSCPFAFTVHDLNHLFVSENSSGLKRLYYSRMLLPAMRRATTVFTVSDFSRQQILEWSGVREDKLICVRQGIAAEFRPDGDVYRSERPFFLHVGNHRPHKNLKRALIGFSVSKLEVDFDFLCTGKPSPQLLALRNDLGLERNVRFLGEVSDVELASLYRGACALVFISLYEGFGLPIVESMACGTPVLTSDVASMPEVAGGAAVLVNPLDVEAISDGMHRVATNETLRRTLRTRGFEQSSRYNWDSAAATVRTALERQA